MVHRLLCIEPGLRLWGSERAFLATLPALIAAYERVVVLVPDGAEIIPHLVEYGAIVETGRLGQLKTAGLAGRAEAAWLIARTCLKHGIDKIYLNQAGLCRIVSVVARLLRIHLVIHVRIREDISRCANLVAYRTSPIDLIFISEDMRARYVEKGGGPKRLVVAYDAFIANASAPIRIGKQNRFICVGRIARTKGQSLLVEAVGICAERGVDLKLDLVGAALEGDPYEAALHAQIRGLPGNIRLLGYRTDVEELLGEYRFLVLPSLYEALGRVILEAWDAGLVPIASQDSGGAGEIIARSGGGILYPGHEPDAIAGAMIRAMALSEADRIAIVQSGREWTAREASMTRYVDVLDGVLFSFRDSPK